MEIETKLFGKVEYNTESVINIPQGLIGIGDNRNFILIDKEDFYPFSYLQSLDNASFTLIVINPFLVEKGYQMDIHRDDLNAIDVVNPEDFIVLALVVFSDKIENITVNLRAPIIINIRSKKGRQILIQNDIYTIAEPLLRKETIASINTTDADSGTK